MIKQRTPKKVIQATGVGLHSGDKVIFECNKKRILLGLITQIFSDKSPKEFERVIFNIRNLICTNMKACLSRTIAM